MKNTITLGFESGGAAHILRRQVRPGEPAPRLTVATIPAPAEDGPQLLIQYFGDLEEVISMLRRAGGALEFLTKNHVQPPLVDDDGLKVV